MRREISKYIFPPASAGRSTFGSFGERDQTGDEHEAIGGASCSEATVLSEAGHLIILSRVTGLSANTKPQGKAARGRKPNDYGTASLTGCT